LSRLLRPRLLIPLAAGVSVVAALVGLADMGKVLVALRGFRAVYVLPIVALIVGYNLVRGLLWYYLLQRVDVRPPLRTVVFSYAVGEITKYSPVGNYVPNYLLHRIRRANFGLSSAATTYVPYSEMAICLLALLALGLDHWTWLRPAILVGLALLALSGTAVVRLGWKPRLPRILRRRAVLEQLHSFLKASKALFRPRVLMVTGLLGATYLLAAAGALLLIARGFGVTSLSLPSAVAAFCFSLLLTLVAPLPTDVGALELSGTGALLALGVPGARGVAIMLFNRLFTVGVALAAAGLVSLLFPQQLSAAMADRRMPAV